MLLLTHPPPRIVTSYHAPPTAPVYVFSIGCPAPLRLNNPCNRGGLTQFVGICECGTMQQGDTRIAELIIDTLAFRRMDMLPYGGYLSSAPVSFCAAYTDVCTRHLAHVQCPPSLRTVDACATPGDLTTFTGTCACGAGYNALPSGRVTEVIMDAMIKPNWWPRLVRLRAAVAPSPPLLPAGLPAVFDVSWNSLFYCVKKKKKVLL